VGESLSRFYQKPTIRYEEALVVALVGLVVNMICAFIMHQGMAKHEEAPHCDHEHSPTHQKHSFVKTAEHHHHHHHHHEHGHHDHNHESAYVHIMTDALTSVFAIIALLLGHWQNWHWADPLVGVIGGLVVLKWSLGLIRESGKELLDAHDASIDRELLIKNLEADGSRVVDLHLWRLAPGQVGCELVIKPAQQQNSAYYRDVITRKFTIQHLIIEVV
jgi:cation diffusion facilitator family transporter